MNRDAAQRQSICCVFQKYAIITDSNCWHLLYFLTPLRSSLQRREKELVADAKRKRERKEKGRGECTHNNQSQAFLVTRACLNSLPSFGTHVSIQLCQQHHSLCGFCPTALWTIYICHPAAWEACRPLVGQEVAVAGGASSLSLRLPVSYLVFLMACSLSRPVPRLRPPPSSVGACPSLASPLSFVHIYVVSSVERHTSNSNNKGEKQQATRWKSYLACYRLVSHHYTQHVYKGYTPHMARAALLLVVRLCPGTTTTVWPVCYLLADHVLRHDTADCGKLSFCFS